MIRTRSATPRRAPRRSRPITPILVGTAALVAVGLTAPADAAQPGDASRFDTWVGYSLGKAPRFPAIGDLNGDGARDVVWGNAGPPARCRCR